MLRDEKSASQGPQERSSAVALTRNNDDRPSDKDRPVATSNETSAFHGVDEIAPDVFALPDHRFGSGQDASPPSDFLLRLRARMRQGMNVWRRHVHEDQARQVRRTSSTSVERGLLAVLSLLVIMSCAGAVGALMQVKSLKSELAILQRELPPLKERIAALDQIERRKEVQEKQSEQKAQSLRETRSEQPPLVLSREEIQLIRDYIKPAPVVGSPTAAVNVGDAIAGPTIPFPSPVTEKIPKLLGATFAIRNGVIVIVRKDSRKADAVLGP
ncbi:hypothetical protein [Bradyrhizobium sp. CCGB20]|uniref:hypothetical protein n=1 Tax=Bradyrhizobium sp. CCGB20 TaxID=2949633 RepID=UPI0020B28E89|nr:hypothetical protein [Bradyrhizobium sp. CCGB20]MCP3401740.1 hypothetical protein [Bradyrhizobium sp. CCGB20]